MSNYYCIINSLVYGEIVSCIVLMLFIIRFTFCSYFHFIFIRGLLSEFNYHNIFQQHDIFIQFLNTYFVSRVSLSINLFNTICVGLLEANTIQIVCACFFVYHFSQPNSLCNEISCYLFSLCVCTYNAYNGKTDHHSISENGTSIFLEIQWSRERERNKQHNIRIRNCHSGFHSYN